MKKFIGDIGGHGVTWIIKYNDDVIETGYLSTRDKNKDQVINEIVEVADRFEAEVVLLASPAAVNTDTGKLKGYSGIEGWNYFNLYEEIKAASKNDNLIVKATNDANAALLGTMLEHPDINYALQVTVGTGIGGSIYKDGKIIFGKDGFGGEFGYMPSFEGIDRSRTVSELCSAAALVKMFDGKYTEAKDVFEKEWNNSKVNTWFNRLGNFLVGINFAFDPEAIFISGGVTKNDDFINKLNEVIEKRMAALGVIERLTVQLSSQNEDVAIKGVQTLLED